MHSKSINSKEHSESVDKEIMNPSSYVPFVTFMINPINMGMLKENKNGKQYHIHNVLYQVELSIRKAITSTIYPFTYTVKFII